MPENLSAHTLGADTAKAPVLPPSLPIRRFPDNHPPHPPPPPENPESTLVSRRTFRLPPPRRGRSLAGGRTAQSAFPPHTAHDPCLACRSIPAPPSSPQLPSPPRRP